MLARNACPECVPPVCAASACPRRARSECAECVPRQHADFGPPPVLPPRLCSRQRVEFSSELKAEASAVTAKCEEESCKVSANLSSLKSAIAERQSSLMIEMDTENRAMKMSIKTVVAETRDLQLGLATLRDEVAQDLQKRLHAHEQKQEAQLRLLAEDADERARVFVKDLEADRQQRCMREDAIQQDIQGWADTCGSLRGEVVGLRTLLLDQSVEASYRHEEADMAAVRDGLVAHTVLGGAAISAAVLL